MNKPITDDVKRREEAQRIARAIGLEVGFHGMPDPNGPRAEVAKGIQVVREIDPISFMLGVGRGIELRRLNTLKSETPPPTLPPQARK